jgi:anti-sigma B factor antagonist
MRRGSRPECPRPSAFGLTIASVPTADSDVLLVCGELDLGTAPLLEQELRAALPRTGRLVIDLKGVAFIDGNGIAVLLLGQRLADSRGYHLSLGRCSPVVTRILRLAGVLDRFAFEQNRRNVRGQHSPFRRPIQGRRTARPHG